MGRKERKRYDNNEKVSELLKKSELTAEEIDFIKGSYTGSGGLSSWSNGQFFTPPAITEFVIDMMGIEPGSRVLEPACGGGAFLERIPPSCDIHAIEYMCTTSHVAQICYPHVHVQNEDALQVEWEELFDYAVMNPPFGLKVNWDFMCDPKKNFKSEIAFLEYGLKNLKEGGILAAIVPDSVLSSANSKPFRQWVIETYKYLCTVSLPIQTFYHVGTSVKTSLIMIEKTSDYDREKHLVFMAVCKEIGWDSRGRKTGKNDLPMILNEYLSQDWNHINRKKNRTYDKADKRLTG